MRTPESGKVARIYSDPDARRSLSYSVSGETARALDARIGAIVKVALPVGTGTVDRWIVTEVTRFPDGVLLQIFALKSVRSPERARPLWLSELFWISRRGNCGFIATWTSLHERRHGHR